MNSNRLIATAVLGAVMIVVIIVIVAAEVFSATSTITVYQVTQAVTPGTPYNSSDVTAVTIKGQQGEFNYFAYSPANASGYVFGQPMAKNDIVQTDDVVAPNNAYAQVSLTLKSSPTLAPGNTIDIYAVTSSAGGSGVSSGVTTPGELPDTPVLIGKNIIVESGNGPGQITILVPPSQASLWLEVSTDTTDYSLYATLDPSGGTPPALSNNGPVYAVQELGQ